MKRSLIGLLALVVLILPGLSMAKAAPKVVVSLKPIHSLVSGIMAGVGEPELLVEGAASPHNYVLRPSEARLLSQADLIIRVGSGLEGFLDKPLTTLGRNADTLELALALKDKLLPARQGGNWERHSHHHDADHAGHDMNHADHHEGEHLHDADHDDHEDQASLARFDQHIWLSPTLAKEIVRLTAAKLIALDPDHETDYRRNSSSVIDRLDRLDGRLKAQLQSVAEVPYVVFHAAYQYFEVSYNLHPAGSISIDPDHRPGARRVKEVRDKIIATQARCVFSEPQFTSRLIATLIEGTDAHTGILDPLGADLAAGPDAYFDLMDNMAKNLYRCLAD